VALRQDLFVFIPYPLMKYIVGNLKMNLLSSTELEGYFGVFKNEFRERKLGKTKIVLCPPFVYIKDFVAELRSKKVEIGVQDVFFKQRGSYTGEISPAMAKSIGANYSIVGHSERRRYFGETNETVNLKIKALIKERMTAIFCLGETLEERKAGLTSQIISNQLSEGLEGISSSGFEKIIFAYEPVWAVGTDVIPTSNGIMEVRILIKKILAEKYGIKHSQKSIILYGGSASIKTISQVCLDPGMDGALVGRESLNPCEFLKAAEMLDAGSCA
jgi:triosephosphate isomerase